MAIRKSGSGGRPGGGGIKAGIITGITMLLIVGFIWAWAQANNIKDFGGALAYFRTWSAQVQACGISDLKWTCDTPIPGYEGGNKAPSDSATIAPAGGEAVAPSAALATLNGITVANPKTVEYVRSQWKHWSDLDGNGCDTREDILISSGKDVKRDPSTCKIISGTWVEPYSNKTFTDSSKMDIDHVVPLAWSASNGGQALSTTAKEQFANDPQNLYISAASENRKKGDKGPGSYLPPNEAFQCQYVTSFVTVVAKYKLTMDKSDFDAAKKVLETKC